MPRSRRHRHEDSESESSSVSSSSSQGQRQRGRNRPHIGVDLRDIPEHMQEEKDYCKRNRDRRGDGSAKAMYADERNGSQVARWGGSYDKGRTVDVGLLSLKCHKSINENKVDFGRMKGGVTNERNQKGIEADVRAVSAKTRVGPVRVTASALGAGYEGGVGRNSGAFVRGNVASVGGSLGPVGASMGIGFDTGARAGADGIEGRFLGCGGMIDRNQGIEVSAFGTSFKFKPW